MALASTTGGSPDILTTGTIMLTADLHGSVDPYAPELTATGVVPGEYIGADIVVDVKGRILYIDDSSFTLPCASAVSCGGVKIPSTGHIDISGSPAPKITIPYATTSDYGVVKLGTGFTSDGCCIRLDYPVATTGSPGLVIIDSSMDVDASGILSIPLATTGSPGVMQVGNGLDISGGGVVSADPSELQYADSGSPPTYGVVAIGDNVNVTSGVISIPVATDTIKGVFRPDGTDFAMNGNEIEEIGSPAGLLSDTTTSSKGIMQVGTHLNVSSGLVGVDKASGATTYGVIRSADTNNLTITTGEIDVGTNIAQLDNQNTYSAGQESSYSSSSAGGSPASVTPDFGNANIIKYTIQVDTTINNPSNMVAGGFYAFILQQDAATTGTVSFGSKYKFYETPILTSTTNAVDIVTMFVKDTNTILCQLTKDYS